MNLHSQLWYVRWFFWCCRVIDRFCSTQRALAFESSRLTKYARGTDLCHFFRILVWGNLIFLVTLSVFGYVLYVVFVLPLILFSFINVTQLVIQAILTLGGIGSLLFGLILLLNALGHWRQSYLLTHPAKPVDPTRPGFWRVIGDYYGALKARLCPIIKFVEAAHEVDTL